MGNTRIPASAVAEVLRSFGVTRCSRFKIAKDIAVELEPMIQVLQVPAKDGGTMDFHIVSPFALMEFLLARSPSYTAVFKEMLTQCPLPWKLCFYADEASTGNLL